MEDRLYLITLFDYYGDLLTDKQIEYFQDYYFDNLTLSEISENNGISRNAVHKALREALDKLVFYEEKLKLMEKRNKIEKIIVDLDDKIKEEILMLV